MTPLVHRGGQAVDIARPAPADAPAEVLPTAQQSAHATDADPTEDRYRGDLFLPGWLRIERQPTAEQGPGG